MLLPPKRIIPLILALTTNLAYSQTENVDPNDVVDLNLEEIPTPEWLKEKLKTAEFEPIDKEMVLGGDSITISMPQDDIEPLPLKDDRREGDVPPLPIEDPQVPPDSDKKPVTDDPVFPDPGSGDPAVEDPFPSDPFDPSDPFPTDPTSPWNPDPWNPDPWNPGGNDNPIVIIDQIVNLGHKIWKIVAENQPVLDIKYKYANAIPKGIEATDLEYFSPIQYKSFRFSGKNGFGSQVFDITYTLVHRYGGKYKNVGAFLERVSVVPHKIEALWGYNINFNVLNVTVANIGSKENPIASMGIDAQLDVGTVIKKSNRRLMFEFRGDSASVRRIAADATH